MTCKNCYNGFSTNTYEIICNFIKYIISFHFYNAISQSRIMNF